MVLLEETFNAEVPLDVVRLTNIAVGPTFSVCPCGDEVGCLGRAHVAPGKEAERWSIGQEGDWQFAFWLIDRGGEWRIAWGTPVDERLARYLAGGAQPFANVKCGLARTAQAGSSFPLSFDLNLPSELGDVKEVSVRLAPEPETPEYPRAYETRYSTYWYSLGGQKVRVTHFKFTGQLGPGGIFHGPVTLDREMPPGKYGVYLGLGTKPRLYWAIPPYVVTVN